MTQNKIVIIALLILIISIIGLYYEIKGGMAKSKEHMYSRLIAVIFGIIASLMILFSVMFQS